MDQRRVIGLGARSEEVIPLKRGQLGWYLLNQGDECLSYSSLYFCIFLKTSIKRAEVRPVRMVVFPSHVQQVENRFRVSGELVLSGLGFCQGVPAQPGKLTAF